MDSAHNLKATSLETVRNHSNPNARYPKRYARSRGGYYSDSKYEEIDAEDKGSQDSEVGGLP